MINVRQLSTNSADFKTALAKLLAFEATQDDFVEQMVLKILVDVKTRGDKALIEYTKRFDHVSINSASDLELSQSELHKALDGLTPNQREALETATARIRAYHERQLLQSWQYEETAQEVEGLLLGQKVTPLDRVGIYVPGGKAAYPSSVLMSAIPAKVAGVMELIMVVPTPHKERNALVLAAAALAKVDRVFTIGGAQAIAALAYGTDLVPKVSKIVGPGNAYVAAAKRKVFGLVGIDMIAGPSEVLIICDGKTNPDWVAMDLFSQAEHDELAQSILLSPCSDYINEVITAMARILPEMPRKEIIRASLENRGAMIHVRNLDEACDIANHIAPEHLLLSVTMAENLVPKIKHAGAIFIGPYSSESLGDYCAGPNHVLPTSGSARFSSPLGVYDFQKRSSLIRATPRAAKTLGKTAAALAVGEGLEAHAESARLRY